MNRAESAEVVKMLQTFWPIEWSQRMSRDMENRLADELTIMFQDYTFSEVQDELRKLARTVTRPPTYKQMLDDLRMASGTVGSKDFVEVQYIYYWALDEYKREYVKHCNVKVYPNGRVVIPKGIPRNERLLRRQGIIDKDGRGIYPGAQPLVVDDPEDVYQGIIPLVEDLFKEQ